MYKFRAGQRVKIKRDADKLNWDGIGFISEMEDKLGTIQTIKYRGVINNRVYYELRESPWSWLEESLESLDQDESVKYRLAKVKK